MLPPAKRGGGTAGGGTAVVVDGDGDGWSRVGLVDRDVAAERDFGVLLPLVLPARGGGTAGGMPRAPGPLDITRGSGTGGGAAAAADDVIPSVGDVAPTALVE